MYQCKACDPSALYYQIRFSGQENLHHIPQIRTYLEKNKLLINGSNNGLVVKEAAVAGLFDYFSDNMNLKDISFRIDERDWRPIQEVVELLEFQWIDTVILEQLVTCHIQPIVDTNEQVYAYEMLSRFEDHSGQAVAPYHVFSAAKNRNRMYALDRVCRMTAVRSAAMVDKKVFINFIPTSIYSPEHCLKSTAQLAGQLGIEPSRFVFEVVETERVSDLEHLKRILMYYREKGFHYALDDVGEGFSTVEVLEQLAPHYMKLDMQFVQGISSDPVKQMTARKIWNSAIQVGAIPLAEGIEDRDDFVWLKKCGYKLFQGYLFGKPAPIRA
ncbi:EAL domain-containing protein [Domibacillus mangrovi]|uniref:Diguanylate phosphodiesterase n=1 Tax=Domibacillus mangrovi TaxID=1714354 RepID=A0A1Q5P7Z9_9BACI|nr:EAL domain-containing protein [Domibacillus mangrovi]OKL38261.1 diguanylate phosphodiesterase [Domibacillus mangrovi]